MRVTVDVMRIYAMSTCNIHIHDKIIGPDVTN